MSGLTDQITCRLPGGYIDNDGLLHQEAEAAPLCGREEEILAEGKTHSSAALVTTLLSRCVRRIGTISPVPEELVRSLLVADRQYLLLKVREVTFGDHVNASIFCPWPDCGKSVDIDFSTKDIPIKESIRKGPTFTMELSSEASLKDENGQVHREIIFRLPHGGDQEMISPLLENNEAVAMTALLRSCILALGGQKNIDEELINRLSPLARLEIEREMESVAPKVEMTMEAACPECGRKFSIPFDLQDFFFGEFRMSRDLLEREVHYLAYHYHWSEREIMEMTRDKRRRYIDVLVDEIERMNHAV
jgi:hypothetical protein